MPVSASGVARPAQGLRDRRVPALRGALHRRRRGPADRARARPRSSCATCSSWRTDSSSTRWSRPTPRTRSRRALDARRAHRRRQQSRPRHARHRRDSRPAPARRWCPPTASSWPKAASPPRASCARSRRRRRRRRADRRSAGQRAADPGARLRRLVAAGDRWPSGRAARDARQDLRPAHAVGGPRRARGRRQLAGLHLLEARQALHPASPTPRGSSPPSAPNRLDWSAVGVFVDARRRTTSTRRRGRLRPRLRPAARATSPSTASRHAAPDAQGASRPRRRTRPSAAETVSRPTRLGAICICSTRTPTVCPAAPASRSTGQALQHRRAARCFVAGGSAPGQRGRRAARRWRRSASTSAAASSFRSGGKDPRLIRAFLEAVRSYDHRQPLARPPASTVASAATAASTCPRRSCPRSTSSTRVFARPWPIASFEAELAALAADVRRPTDAAVRREHASPSRSAAVACWLKREDLAHTGAHKINNARRPGPARPAHGQASASSPRLAPASTASPAATVCAMLGLECVVYMGEEDMQPPGAERLPHALARRRGAPRDRRHPHAERRDQRGLPRLGDHDRVELLPDRLASSVRIRTRRSCAPSRRSSARRPGPSRSNCSATCRDASWRASAVARMPSGRSPRSSTTRTSS